MMRPSIWKPRKQEKKFDVIICDSSDPIGPAQALFESAFYRNMNQSLKPGGRISTQAESVWMHLELIQSLFRKTRSIFGNVEYATTQVPTYPCGQIGFLMCCKTDGKTSDQCRVPVRRPPDDMPLHYYSTELHSAAFVLPAFVTRAIAKVKAETASATTASATTASASMATTTTTTTTMTNNLGTTSSTTTITSL